MISRPASPVRFVLLAGIALTAGCQTARMPAPAALATVEPMQVEGANPRKWNQAISFGPWATSSVDEGLTWNFLVEVARVRFERIHQPYRVALSGEGATLQAECMTRALLISYGSVSAQPVLRDFPPLTCAFHGAGTGVLELWPKGLAMREEGTVDFGSGLWTVRAVHAIEGGAFAPTEPSGYEIVSDGETIAAVETINRGRVWISPSLSPPDRNRAAIIATALLLYEPAEETGQRP